MFEKTNANLFLPKTLHLSSSDINGGAARATYRLHQGLRKIGVDSNILVQEKSSNDLSVIGPKNRLEQSLAKSKLTFDAYPLKFYKKRKKSVFSLQWTPSLSLSRIKEINPDIIHLHWINEAFLRVEDLAKLDRPIFWTLHDMWPFTGGCHYSEECENYMYSCGKCPHLGSEKQQDLSRWLWQRKSKSWEKLNITIVSPSDWLAQCASQSSLFRNLDIRTIHHGLNTEAYNPVPKKIARSLLNISIDKKIVLFGAISSVEDTRKGFYFLQLALEKISQSEWKDKVQLLIFGNANLNLMSSIDIESKNVGRLCDDISLTLLYSAADVMVVPSTQEAFGQTASEALACGTPVASFDTTGLRDIVDHKHNGYLAKCFDAEDLAFGITWILEEEERYNRLCLNSRQKAQNNFDLISQSQEYLKLYREKLNEI